MAAFNFPNSPSTNDLHTENSVTWKWDGVMWNRVGPAYTDTTNLNVTGIGTFAGDVHIAGVLTYEDVKNVDSVGVITARQGLRITGGGLDVVGVSTFNDNVKLLDGDKLLLGTGSDYEVYHDGSNAIHRVTGDGDLKLLVEEKNFIVQGTGGHQIIKGIDNGAAELYHNNTKTIETTSGGAQILNGTGDAQLNIRGGSSDGRSTLQFISDDNNANNDNFRLRNDANNDFYLQNYASGSWETNIKAVGDGAVELYYNNAKVLETYVNRITLTGNASECNITCKTSDGTTRGILGTTNSNSVTLYSGSSTKVWEYTSNALNLYHAGTKQCETHSEGFTIKGGNTSSVTRLRINGNEGQDAHILMSADDGDDNADHWRLRNIASDNSFDLVSYASGAYQSVLKGTSSRALELHYQGTKQAETISTGFVVKGGNTSNISLLRVIGNEGQNAELLLTADDGDDNGDNWKLRSIASDNSCDLVSYASGSYQSVLKGTSSRTVELHYQGTKKLETLSSGVTISSSNTNATTTNWNGAVLGIQNTHDTDNNSSVLYFMNSAGGTDCAIQGIHEDAAGTSGARRGHIQFGTSGSDSSGSCVERVRIESHGDVAINTTDGDFGQTNASSNFAKGDPKLGVLGSIAIGNFSTTTTDFSQLSFYRRHGATAGANGRLQSTHNLGRISWNGASNDTSFPDEVCAIQAVATGGDWWAASARRATLQFHQYHGEALRIVNSNTQSYTGGSADNRYAEVQVRHKTPYSTDGGYPGGSQTSTNQINFSIYNEHYGGNRLAFRSGGASQFELETKTRDVGSGSYNDADVYFRSQYDGALTDRYVMGTQGGHTFKSRSKDTFGVGSGGDIWFGENPYNSQWSATNAGGWYYREDQTSMIVASRAHTGYSTFYINKNTGGGSSDTRWIDFYWNANQYGRISYNGASGTNYTTSSDYRLKENVVSITDGIAKVKQLKPYRFNFKSDTTDKVVQGFFAHEAQEVVPYAVSGTKDEVVTQAAVDEGSQPEEKVVGDPIYQDVDYAKFTPILTAALQEAIGKIEVLEAKVAALEGS